MPNRPLRKSSPGALGSTLLVVLILAAACGVSRGSPGVAADLAYASGRSVEVSGDELDDLVAEITSSSDFVELAYQGAVPPDLQASVLGLMILDELQAEELVSRDIDVPPAAVDQILTELDGELLSGFERLGSENPQATTDQVKGEIDAYLRLLAERIAGEEVLTEDLTADAEPEFQTLVCSRHILLDSEAEADAAIERLADGEDFAELAAELSTGPSGPTGGDLGCSDPASFVPEFAAAITDAPINEVIGPVQTDFGFHVIRVDGTEEQSLPINGQALFFDAIGELATSTTVTVDPLVGSWDAGSLTVVAP